MQMRLAFAVAAHLEPEILLVDEVLAVGDAAFQQKCLGKMQEVNRGGRTVLLVSHQMNQLRRLCTRCLWLQSGRLAGSGPAAPVLGAYEASFRRAAQREADPDETDVKQAKFLGWHLDGHGSSQGNVLTTTGPVEVTFQLEVRTPIPPRAPRHRAAVTDRPEPLGHGRHRSRVRARHPRAHALAARHSDCNPACTPGR